MDELEIEDKKLYQERHNELVKIVESFASLEKSEEWATLKELVFDKELEKINRLITIEALNGVIDVSKMYRLQGRRDFARQFCDVKKYVDMLVKQLEELKKHI